MNQTTQAPHRRICGECGYIQANCVCAHIKPQLSNNQFIIIQHPKECQHPKGSAKLVKLSMENCQIWIGETPEELKPLKKQLNNQKPCYLVYPTPEATDIESLRKDKTKYDRHHSITLVFIDASWKKAHKIYALNPWLQQLPTLTFSNQPATRYKIRQTKRKNSLSTLEAVAYCIEQLENRETSALHELFDAMIDNQWRHMSTEVKQRY